MKTKTLKILEKIGDKYLIARASGQKQEALNLWKLKIKLETYLLRKN